MSLNNIINNVYCLVIFAGLHMCCRGQSPFGPFDARLIVRVGLMFPNFDSLNTVFSFIFVRYCACVTLRYAIVSMIGKCNIVFEVAYTEIT